MIRKEGSKQSEGGSDLQRAENHNLGLPNPNRHSNFLYFSIYKSYFIDICKMHMLYENARRKYMKVTEFYNSYYYKIRSNYDVFGSLASGFSHIRKIQKE